MKKLWLQLLALCCLCAVLVLFYYFGGYAEPERENGLVPAHFDAGITTYLTEEEISALYLEDNTLYVGTKNGILILDAQTGEELRWLNRDIQMIYAADICKDGEDTIWAGDQNGLWHLDRTGEVLDFFEAPEIPEGRVNTILYEPKEDAIYVGTLEGTARLAKTDLDRWQVAAVYTQENGLLPGFSNVIKQVHGGLWIGGYLSPETGITIRNEDGSFQYFTLENGLLHPYVNTILQADEENVLVGFGQMDKGALLRFTKSGDSYRITDCWDESRQLPGNKIRFLFSDSMGGLWITTESDGLVVVNQEKFIRGEDCPRIYMNLDSGLADNEVKVMVEAESCFWLGGKYGLTKIEKSISLNIY